MADFSLFDRLRGYNDLGERADPTDPAKTFISTHPFYGALLYVIHGTKTRQEIIDTWNLTVGKQQNELNAFFNGYNQATDKAWYLTGVHALFLTASLGDEAGFPEQLVVDTWQLTKDGPPANSVN